MLAPIVLTLHLMIAAALIGVVLLHSNLTGSAFLLRVTPRIVAAGYPTEAPNLCWARERFYDRPHDQCLLEIDMQPGRTRDQPRASGAGTPPPQGIDTGGHHPVVL